MTHLFPLKNAPLALSLPLLVASALPQTSYAQDIVISASRVEVARESTGSAITIIDGEYLEQNQSQILSDILRDMPGLAVSRSGPAGGLTQVRIRGAEGNQTLVLIDGIEVNDLGSGSEFDFSSLINLDIERIEVLRGAQSALWGSDAMGGVINIITKKGKGGFNGRIRLEQGSFGTHQETINLNGGNERAHFSLNASLLESDGISAASEANGNHEEDGFENQSISLRSGFKPSDALSVEVFLRRITSDIETDAFAVDLGAEDADNLAEKTESQRALTLRWEPLGGNWRHTWRLSENENSRQSYSAGVPSFLSEGKKTKYEYQSDYLFTSGDWDFRTTLAFEQEDDDFLSQGFSTVKRDTRVRAGIFEYGVNFNDTIYATLSGRRDSNDIFKNANTYRINLAGWANDNLRLHASKGTGVKNPTMFELFGFTDTYAGNSNLEPEKNRTWDVGTEFHFDALEGYLDLTYFKSDIENLIQGSGNTSINRSSESTVKGLELTAAFEPSKQLRVNASYTYTDTDDGEGNALVRRAKHIASLNSSYLFNQDKTRVTGGLQYNGTQEDLKFDAFFNTTQVRLSAYTLVNLAVSHMLDEHITLFARIENLTDEDYEEIVGYGTEGIGGTVGIQIEGLL